MKDKQYLESDMYKKNRRYHVTNRLFQFFVVLGLVLLASLQLKAISNFNKQSEERKQGIVAIENAINAKIDRQSQQISCIAKFFTQPNRANKSITSVDSCSIDIFTPMPSTPSSGAQSTTPNSAPQPSNAQPVAQPAQSTPQSTSGLQKLSKSITNVVDTLRRSL